MKTLLQINTVNNYSSTGRSTEDMGQAVIGKGWNSYIVYGRHKRTSSSKLIKIGTNWDLYLHGLRTRILDQHGLGSINATKKLIVQIIKIRPDIIHLHNLHGYYINIELLFKYLNSINTPVVWTFHDYWPMTGHCVYFDYIECKKWETLCFSCPLKNDYPASFCIDRSKKNYFLKKAMFTSLKDLTIIPVSEWSSNVVKHSYFANNTISVIHNGIDTEIFHPQKNSNLLDKYNIKDKFIILGVANQWGLRKGLDDFVELSKNLDPDCQIIMIGLNKRQIKKLPSNIIGILRTENVQKLVDFYSISDVYINLSVEETFGKTTIEAMACGTPVIVYNATASPELVSPRTGIIVEKKDIQGLLKAIHLVKTKGKISYSNACRERAESLFDKNRKCNDIINLYETLLSRMQPTKNL